ncbi:hypothetical protein [Micromonospora sp. WMMD998]|uniref:hypothetical protein n=1 Tax=Micromonospora sp. WMMD998 TaxID=3016092 RepID=UPI00249B4102|nr:hypothetical protein [Micromonospora sp. WMMD998]WFE37691.1 hypothetical protein O7619_04275 [Micromonospora sp. WMMD998]
MRMKAPGENDQESSALVALALVCDLVASFNEAAASSDEPGLTGLVLLVLVVALVNGLRN